MIRKCPLKFGHGIAKNIDAGRPKNQHLLLTLKTVLDIRCIIKIIRKCFLYVVCDNSKNNNVEILIRKKSYSSISSKNSISAFVDYSSTFDVFVFRCRFPSNFYNFVIIISFFQDFECMGTRKPSSLRATKKKKGFKEVATRLLRSGDSFVSIVIMGYVSMFCPCSPLLKLRTS